MKLIKEWEDTFYNITNKLYELKNGTLFLHCINPNTIELNYSVTFNGGTSAELDLGVPNGTAHFLEHCLADNPNEFIKDQRKYYNFHLGDRKNPYFSHNAYTNFQKICFETNGNQKAYKRMIKFVNAQIKKSDQKIEEYMTRDRNIILAEIARESKPEKDSHYLYRKFVYGDVYPEYNNHVLGTKESLNNITIHDLLKYRHKIFQSKNAGIAIQTKKKKLSKFILQELESLDKFLSKNEDKKQYIQNFKNLRKKFDNNHHYNEGKKGIYVELGYFYKQQVTELNYKEDRLRILIFKMIQQVMYKKFREEEEYVYSISLDKEYPPKFYIGKTLNYTVSIQNLLKSLNKMLEIIQTDVEEEIKSEEGKAWLENHISHYIYPINSYVQYSYGTDLLERQLNNYDIIFDYEKSKAEMHKLTTNDLLEFYNKFFKKLKPIIWLESSLKDDKINSIFKKSTLYKHYTK